MSTSNKNAAVHFQSTGMPRARYSSGLSICDEALIGGRWVGRYWTDTGFVESEKDLDWLKEEVENPGRFPALGGLDAASFGLVVNGQSAHFGWEMAGMRTVDAARPGNVEAVVTLRSTIAPVEVEIHTVSDGTGIFERWLTIKNESEAEMALGEVSPWSGLMFRPTVNQVVHRANPIRPSLIEPGQPAFSVGYMAETMWGHEGAFKWIPLPSTALRLESRSGKSGHGTPFFVVRDELTGEHVIGGLGWSGNWSIELTAETQSSSDPLLAFKIGPQSPSPQRVIAAGETVETPHVHLGRLQTDFNGAIQAWHKHLRKSVLLPELAGKEGLVILNHWGYVAHELTEERLMHEVDVAVEIGAELLIIDAGWFGNAGEPWWSTVGDWDSGDRLPNGLEPIFAYARKKGLKYGLWFDLERFGESSRVVKEHPEWLLNRYGRTTTGGEIDLTNPEAVAYIEAKLYAAIDRYNLDLFRLDYNTSPQEGGQTSRGPFTENTLWRYYEQVYALYDRLHERYPNLILETCAGGGGRTDLGLVSRFHHTWVTDWQIAPRSVSIVNGMSMALPPERIDRMAGVGQSSHIRADLDFQLRSCMFGHFTLSGISLAAGQENPAQVARVRHHVGLYKDFIRPFIATCDVYHHTPELTGGNDPTGHAVLEYVADDKKRAMVGVFRLVGPAPSEYALRLRGLDAGRTYRMTLDNSGEVTTISGAQLMQTGIVLRLDRALTSELLLLEAIQ